MKKSPGPPKALSTEAKRLWRELIEEFCIDDAAGLLLLQTALESFDVKDRFGQKRQHPATLVLRDSRNLMLRSLKALNLDVAPGSPLKGGGN
jgi:hypothetical protein